MPLPPPPADAFSSDGQADLLGAAATMPASVWSPGVSPGTTGTPARCISARAPIFEPMRAIAVGRRADEDEAGVRAGGGERRVLGEEAVAGVDRVGAAAAGRVDDACRCRR